MAFGGLRRFSFITHGWRGWWWAKLYAYPRDPHGVEILTYGWVEVQQPETEAADAARPEADLAAGSNVTTLPTRV